MKETIGGKLRTLIGKIKGFLSEVRIEGKKVTWLTRKELLASTLVVIVTVLLVAAFIGLLDFLFSFIMGLFFR